MTEASSESTEALAGRVYTLVQSYVRRRTEARCGRSFEQYRASGYKDPVYVEANNKVCMDAFYAIRSRKDQADFVNYFTGTICSVPQFLPAEEYRAFAASLLDSERCEDIKSLALLALSASAQVPSKEGDQK